VAVTALLRLAGAWHARVLAHEVVSHAFSHRYHPQHTERLAAYWAEALGGPTTYSQTYGEETSVVRLHSGNGPHEEMDGRAIACISAFMSSSRVVYLELMVDAIYYQSCFATEAECGR
jgi:hemoglobin